MKPYGISICKDCMQLAKLNIKERKLDKQAGI